MPPLEVKPILPTSTPSGRPVFQPLPVACPPTARCRGCRGRRGPAVPARRRRGPSPRRDRPRSPLASGRRPAAPRACSSGGRRGAARGSASTPTSSPRTTAAAAGGYSPVKSRCRPGPLSARRPSPRSPASSRRPPCCPRPRATTPWPIPAALCRKAGGSGQWRAAAQTGCLTAPPPGLRANGCLWGGATWTARDSHCSDTSPAKTTTPTGPKPAGFPLILPPGPGMQVLGPRGSPHCFFF